MKILLFGGSGTLGTELIKIDSEIIHPISLYVNICDFNVLFRYINEIKPDVIINAAAEIDNVKIEKFPSNAILTNIVGAANLAIICRETNIRLVYISTDYVYSGSGALHVEGEGINPKNLYAWTKLGGECSAECVVNHLIIRTSFGRPKFPYDSAYINLYTSKDYVDIIAPMIYKAALSRVVGVLNVGTERKTMYDYAIIRNKNVNKGFNFKPQDFSLNLNKYNNEVR